MSGKQTFQKLEGGKEIELENPRNCTGYICKGLTPDKSYVFRLIATNASGDAVGEIGGPVKTVGKKWRHFLPPPKSLLGFSRPSLLPGHSQHTAKDCQGKFTQEQASVTRLHRSPAHFRSSARPTPPGCCS